MLPLSMICDVNLHSRHENILFCITVLHYGFALRKVPYCLCGGGVNDLVLAWNLSRLCFGTYLYADFDGH